MSKWISVEDRLPEPGYYLAYSPEYYGIALMEYGNFGPDEPLQWWADDTSPTSTVTHWQPLPDPPEK